MKFRFSLVFALTLFATAAFAADFGVHAGYYTDDINKAFIGADMRFPLGPVTIMPNVDYTRVEDANFFFGSLDVNLQYATSPTGPSYWIGAGPTVGYVRFNGESDNETGYDVNGGISWNMGGLRPYVTARYIKLDDFNTLGAAVGLRF